MENAFWHKVFPSEVYQNTEPNASRSKISFYLSIILPICLWLCLEFNHHLVSNEEVDDIPAGLPIRNSRKPNFPFMWDAITAQQFLKCIGVRFFTSPTAIHVMHFKEEPGDPIG